MKSLLIFLLLAAAHSPAPRLVPWGSRHATQVGFADYSGVWQTHAWEWTSAYPHLAASDRLPLGSRNVRGSSSGWPRAITTA